MEKGIFMRKKVMIMLLAASMIGSSVPAGVMAADVTDFAREAVGAEERMKRKFWKIQ